jgi:hypothetical protein
MKIFDTKYKEPWTKEDIGTVISSGADINLTAVVIQPSHESHCKRLLFVNHPSLNGYTVAGLLNCFEKYTVLKDMELTIRNKND